MVRFLVPSIIAASCLFGVPASAQNSAVKIDSKNFVEKTITDSNGQSKTTLLSTNIVVPGDIIVFTHDYVNSGDRPTAGYLINYPLSKQIEYIDSPDANISVSVDGGTTFGKLGSLQVAGRAATASDVTHLRWTFAQPIQPGQKGKVSFRGRLK